jgi:DNA-binding response OmpR family regulator
MAKILLVEDDEQLAGVIADWLTYQGYDIDCVKNGTDAEQRLQTSSYELVILDWGLPDIQGIDICQNYRATGGQALILMLTGKRDVREKETGFDAGADDYLTKPFDVKELSARVRSLLRRPPEIKQNTLSAGNITLDPISCVVSRDQEPLKLFPKEYALLEFFLRHPNQVFSPESLLDHVWHSEAGVGPETVRTSIKRLRKQIDCDEEKSLIENVRGVGYKLNLP